MRIDLGDVEAVLELRVKQQPPPIHLDWTLGPIRDLGVRAEPSPAAPPSGGSYLPSAIPPAVRIIVKDTQAADFAVSLKDARGFPTNLDGVDDTIEYSLAPDGVATLVVNEDQLTGTVTAAAPGDAVLSVDVSLGDGRTAHGSVAVSVTAGDVAEIAVTLGDPRDV